ncbi:MAG: hypothetical protein LBH82_03470 [Bacteroidales bacterium]|jgi:hypothetical protein|nr:hypothetical protein [Bacteroidales bacterium]
MEKQDDIYNMLGINYFLFDDYLTNKKILCDGYVIAEGTGNGVWDKNQNLNPIYTDKKGKYYKVYYKEEL